MVDSSEVGPECPECGEDMVKRKNNTTDSFFWGCPMYPQCDGTVTISEPEPHPGYPSWASE